MADLESLKRSRAGYKGLVTKLYTEVERLLCSFDNFDLVKQKVQDLQRAFDQLCAVNEQYISEVDSSEALTVNEEFETQHRNKAEFDQRIEDWMKQRNSPKSVRSENGSRKSDQKKKGALLELRLLQRKHELERRKQELKQEEELLEVEAKLERERLEGELSDEDDDGNRGDITIAKRPDDRFFAGGIKPEPDVPAARYVNTNLEPKIEATSGSTQQVLQSLAAVIDLPRPELLTFDGDPKKYFKFISNFETSIGSRNLDDRIKLSYLIQQCSGPARDCIEDCVILDHGFERACDILRRRFGRAYIVANAHISEIVDGPPLQGNDGKGLQRVADDMRRCELVLTQMGYQADMNNTENLRKIVRRLPFHIRARWVDKADRFLEAGVEPNFAHLTEFVEERARVANTAYGHDLNASPAHNSKPALRNSHSSRRGTSFSMQGNNVGHTDYNRVSDSGRWRNNSCPCCSGSHQLSACRAFSERPFAERRKIMRDNKMCDNCFRRGHFAKGCMERTACDVQGCKWKHHKLLHPPPMNRKPDDQYGSASSDSRNSRPEKQDSASGNCASTMANRDSVCLRIVPVRVKGRGTKETEVYALLDNGSDISLCTSRLADQLGLRGKPKTFSLTTVSDQNHLQTGREVSLSVSGLTASESIDIDRVWTVKDMSIPISSIPKKKDVDTWGHLQGLNLPKIDKKEVSLLIGAQRTRSLLGIEERRGRRKEPYAIALRWGGR
ncbi:PREDICTED: uncharacterized protein LOC106815198 [Priapulus caudatus]|uniref:Uncharacterized protein LOC106815198 n=1 Tax=Priapulus caudatus TaxID=37621 RepID=A0ABM1ESE3_PRICU|nr:PREDICTED: uncharacterized protein LOC106815198 [Priapulus caudatus]